MPLSIPKKVYFLLLLVAVGLVLLLSRTSNNEQKGIRIGTVYQLSGSGVAYGNLATRGVEIAVEEINNHGGINGRKLEVVAEDSRSNTKDAMTAMTNLIELQKVKFIFSQQSGIVLALTQIANNNRTILLDTGATTPLYTSPDDYTLDLL